MPTAIIIQRVAKVAAMKGLASVIRKFPMQELAIRRYYASDPDFEEACEDLLIANRSLERWQADGAKAAELKALIEEIEREITEYLERPLQQPIEGDKSCE